MNNGTTHVDVLIAGQGAAAYSAALYAARYRLEILLVSEMFGGETAIGGLIENYPGTPDIDGYELMMKFKEQVAALEVPIVSSDLKEARLVEGGFECVLGNGDSVICDSLILAIGRERRKLGLSNEEDLIGRGLSYCSTCDAPLYRNKSSVAVVGGGNAAVEGAILLAKYVPTVYLIYRQAKFFRPEPILLETLAETPEIRTLFLTNVTEIVDSREEGITHIKITPSYEGEDTLKIDGLFVEAGADPRNEIPKSLGVGLDPETGEVKVDRRQHTNLPGLYAAGDLTDGSPLKQTVTAASQGAVAALSAYQYVMEKKVGQKSDNSVGLVSNRG